MCTDRVRPDTDFFPDVVMSFNEASRDVMGLLFFCPSFFLSFFLYCLIVCYT